MRKALIISLDLIRLGEPATPLSTASLLAYLRSAPEYGDTFTVEHLGINLLEEERDSEIGAVEAAVRERDPGAFDAIAVACYVWSERVTGELLRMLRRSGFCGTLILGGPQITYASQDDLPMLYPDADIFVTGYAEAALHRAIVDVPLERPAFVADEVDFDALVSPYLTGALAVAPGQERVRMETRRGCPFRCSFCAHRDLKGNRIHKRPQERVRQELNWLSARGVRKVNFLDPVFNQGTEYLELLEHMVASDFRADVTFQSRFELIRNTEGERFIELAGKLNACLEFGLQTANGSEGKAVNRVNAHDKIRDAMRALDRGKVPYEVSLIYGLPGQTVQSFAESVLFLQDNGCSNIVAFPLMLLRGTELFAQKEKWGYKERPEGRFGIPVVYESASFTESEWFLMKDIADGLGTHERV
jgi:radical SAM superfamily enzyme YgiQ (UPF0313 family)